MKIREKEKSEPMKILRTTEEKERGENNITWRTERVEGKEPGADGVNMRQDGL